MAVFDDNHSSLLLKEDKSEHLDMVHRGLSNIEEMEDDETQQEDKEEEGEEDKGDEEECEGEEGHQEEEGGTFSDM